MPRIRILPPALVNRIAAGECVERPASVVKELVENALDAGATRIDVTIHDGGRELIQVVDDGCGMDAEDLRLAVTPHATSKIQADDDLFNIHTMGFRGEALPSIASVSRLKITSRPQHTDSGHCIRVEGGQVGDVAACGTPPGTIVEVRDLFYCVPARRRFLRANSTETGHITEQLARIALAYPGVAFSLANQQRATHQLPATSDRRQRIADFFGPELADVLLPIEREGGGVRLDGFAAPPAQSRGSGKWEYVFVNGRFVRDRFVSHAVKEAYRSLIDPRRFPVAFLFITIDPGSVDVNVHPTKSEVRWRDSNYIHGQVLAALRDRFLSTNLDRTLRTPAQQDEYRESVRQAMVDFFTKAGERPAGAADSRHRSDWESARSGRAASRDELAEASDDVCRAARISGAADGGRGTASAPRGRIAQEPGWAAGNASLDTQRESAAGEGHSPPAEPAGGTLHNSAAGTGDPVYRETGDEPCGPVRPSGPRALQIHNTYLVVETDDGCMIIDQHALHERILYEELRARVTQRTLESQRLLIPDVVRVPADRIEALESHADTLARLGIELTATGPQSVALHAFPSFLERADRPRFVRDLLDLLSEAGARPQPETLLHELLDLMACKAAVKAGDPLNAAEIAALLQRREAAERSSNCPHGRPTTLHLTLRDLERQFKRR